MRRSLLILMALALAGCGTVQSHTADTRAQREKTLDHAYPHLKMGMTFAQVRHLIGKPDDQQTGNWTEWDYGQTPTVNDGYFPVIILDFSHGKLDQKILKH